MKVAIIGAGFGGMAAAYRLASSGVEVYVFESEDRPGGLAVGFKEPGWKWSFEKHYHHWFTSDWAIRNLADEIGHKVIFTTPKTSTFVDGKTYQLDSPLSLLLFDKLSLKDRLRTGLILAYLKCTSNWKSLESRTSEDFIKRFMGETSWKVLWQPLFEKKFDSYANEIPASWFWARIKKRSASLGYPEGGFFNFAVSLDSAIRKRGGKVFYNTKIEKIAGNKDKVIIKTSKQSLATMASGKQSLAKEYLGKQSLEFDKVICTLPSPLFVKITEGLPQNYIDNLLDLKGVGTVNLVLSLKKQFLEDNTYWLNVNAQHFPFLAIVEHTNFINKKYYNDEHLVYVGNYLPHEHPYYRKEAGDLLREFYPFLKTINPKFDKSWVNRGYLFKASFAQPIPPLNYSQKLPAFETPINNLYLCNIQQVYPWDRGTNYAVENGTKVADIILAKHI